MSAPAPSGTGRAWARALLAGPFVLIAACLLMAGSALWLPRGRADVNQLVLPVVLFPLLWTALFLYACVDKHLLRAYLTVGLIVALNAALLSWHLLG